MSGWIVYSKDGSHERCKLRSLEYGGTAMGERAVTATFDFHSEVAFEVFDYIEYRGERFELEAVPTVKKLSSFEYQYELRFVSLKYELERCEMRDLVPSDNGVVYPTPLTFSFTGDVRYLTDRIQACLDAMYGAGVWKITIAEGTSSEEKNITIAQQNCWNALALVNSTYGLNFYIKGRTITIGGEQPLVSHTFEYGKGNGLYEIERASDTETGIVTKLRAYGSTRNLDYSYPKKPEWSDSVLPVSFALSPLRLMLPSFKTDGKTDYVLADDAAIAKYGIREASMVYDDIYPSIAGATYNGQAIDEIKAVDAVDESQKTFVVYLHELGFDLEEHLTTSDAQISMKSGALQGYTFTISSIEKQTGGYKITLGKNSLENSEESGAYVPGVNWNMKAGDKFVLLNILMPQKYIRDAENRLLARANEYLAQYSKTNFSYNIGLHDKFLIQNPSVYDSLIEGSKLKVYDKEIGIDEEVTIQSITITENLEDNILPQVKVTLNNEPSASTLDRIQGKLNEVAAETAANGFTTQSEIMAQYRRKLDKPFFDKLFVAIDANGNEIPSTDVITPIAYIKAKYHVVSVGGFTMYAMDKDVDVPSLASGLPFDGRTIWYNPETNQIEVIGGTGGGSGEGVSNFWDLSGIPSWITNSKPKYTYSEIEGTPDLTKYALVSQIPSLSGYATESWVLQKNYATKATTLSGYGITDAYTKTNVDDLLKSYVTLGGTQTITGEKNFVGGLKVNGSPIYYDREKKYWKFEGDLLVTGGVTMYGSDSSFTPSTIMDALLYDDATLGINSNGQLYVKGGTSGGGLDITALQNYLTSNSYLNVTSGDNRYLKLSGGTLSGGASISWGDANNGLTDTSDWNIKTDGLRILSSITSGSNAPSQYAAGLHVVGRYGFQIACEATSSNFYMRNIRDGINDWCKLWHAGNFTPSDYLPLSGGTMTGNILLGGTTNKIGTNIINTTSGYQEFTHQNSHGYVAIGPFNSSVAHIYTDRPSFYFNKELYVNNAKVWNASNDGSGSTLDADLLDGKHDGYVIAESLRNRTNDSSSIVLYSATRTDNTWPRSIVDNGYGLMIASNNTTGYIATVNSNVASATKLQTARTIWGKSFDGTGNIDGDFTQTKGGSYGGAYGDNSFYIYNRATSDVQGRAGVLRWSFNNYSVFKSLDILGENSGTTTTIASFLDNGNVGIGTTNPSSLLHVNGEGRISDIHFRGSYMNLNRDGATGGMYDSTKTALEIEATSDVSILRTYNVTRQASVALHTNGNIGIGTINPNYKLTVNGDSVTSNIRTQSIMLGYSDVSSNITTNRWYYASITYADEGQSPSYLNPALVFKTMNNTYQPGTEVERMRICSNGNLSIGYAGDKGTKLYVDGNILAYGGVTMYSDKRKKTILNHVELSLKQIANAPLIEHYYNGDDKKTTHVGSIAQYWANMNDWFCKLDSEGYYTMEIQNAALASAISIARELDRYETKTDKDIKKLKKRICELEEEVERLKSA